MSVRVCQSGACMFSSNVRLGEPVLLFVRPIQLVPFQLCDILLEAIQKGEEGDPPPPPNMNFEGSYVGMG